MAAASETATALTAAWVGTGVPSKNAKEVVEFYHCIYDELIATVEKSRRSADQGLQFDKYGRATCVLHCPAKFKTFSRTRLRRLGTNPRKSLCSKQSRMIFS